MGGGVSGEGAAVEAEARRLERRRGGVDIARKRILQEERQALLPATRCRASGQLGALLSSPVLDVRLMTALQVLQDAGADLLSRVCSFLLAKTGTILFTSTSTVQSLGSLRRLPGLGNGQQR